METIGVVIPTYNRTELLSRAIDSVLEQSYRPERIVVVDDASNIDIRHYLSQYTDDITIIVHDKNRGAGAARNTGFNNLNTDYVAFLDSDDHWKPTKLEKQLEVARNQRADLVYCDQWVVDQEGTKHPSNKRLLDENILNALLEGWTAPNTSTLFIDSDTFEKVDGFDESFSSCQDHDLWMRLALRNTKFAYVTERLSFFTRDTENRISLSKDKRMEGINLFLNKWRSKIIEKRGYLHYLRFKWNYYISAWPILKKHFQNDEYWSAIMVFSRYLAINPIFILKAIRKITALLD